MKKYLILPALLLSLSACAEGGAARVTRLNGGDDVKIVDMRSVEKNKLLNVQVTLKNTSWSESDIMYRFKWVDSNGFALAEETWKPLKLYSDQTIQVVGIAPSPAATDFNVEITD